MSPDADAPLAHVFVYGTLRPGESRWHHLSPYVVDEGFVDTAAGAVYDTGQGYPAALFGGDSTIVGRTFGLLMTSIAQALAHLDDVEGAVDGLYRRIVVRTGTGVAAYAYEYGGGLELSPIISGDWLSR